MKKLNINNLEDILGYNPGREQKRLILDEVAKGKTLVEAAQAFSMPPLFVQDENGLIAYKGERMTIEQFREKHPYTKYVLIRTKNQFNEKVNS